MDHSNHIPYQGAREDMYKIFIGRARELINKFGVHIPDRELQELRLEVRGLNRENFRFLQEWTGAPALAGIEKSEVEIIKRTIQESDVLFGSKYADRLAASVDLYRTLQKHHMRLSKRSMGKPLFTIGAMYDLTTAVYESLAPRDRTQEIRGALELLEQFIRRMGDESMKQTIVARQHRAALQQQMANTILPLKALMNEQEIRISREGEHAAEYTAHAQEVRTNLYQKVTALISLKEMESALSLMQEALRLDEFALSLIEEGAHRESGESATLWDERELFALAMDNAGREYEAYAQDIRNSTTARASRKTRLKDEEEARSYQERARVCYEIAHALREGDLAALLNRELDVLLAHSTHNGQDSSVLKERHEALITVSELAKQNIQDAIAFAFKAGIVTSRAQAYALTLAPLLAK